MDAQQIAESLKTDPFYIDESVASQLDPRLLEKAKTKAEELDFDVYVIAVDADSLDRDMLQQIKVFNGGEGSFIMINGTDALAVEQYFKDDQHDLNIQVMEQMSNARDEWSFATPSETKLNILLDLYADPQPRTEEQEGETGQVQPGNEITQDTNSGSFAPLFLGGSVLVLALVIAGVFLLRSIRAKRESNRRAERFQLPGKLLDRVDGLQRKTLRENINADTTELADTLSSLQTEKLDSSNAAKVSRALDAYQMARGIVDDETSDRIDLAGAMVLLRQAGREIAEVDAQSHRKRGPKPSRGLPQSLCTINPLHGEARTTARVETGGKGVRVPVCPDCLQDLQAGNQLQWIYDGDEPYVQGSSVWAETLFGAIGGDLVTALHRVRPD